MPHSISFEVDLRPAFLHLSSGQLTIFHPRRTQHLYRSALKDVIAFRSHPQNASAVQELLLPLPLVFRPQEECARRHCGIWLVGPVSPAHDARLSARRRSRISRSPGIEQCDLRAALEQVQGSPSAESSGSHDRDMRSGFHWKRLRIPVAVASKFQGRKTLVHRLESCITDPRPICVRHLQNLQKGALQGVRPLSAGINLVQNPSFCI